MLTHKQMKWAVILAFITAVLVVAFVPGCKAAELSDKQCIRAVIGEASNQGYEGMLAVACGIRNRGTLKGVYGANAKHIDNEPMWVWKIAKRAWRDSEFNKIHTGTHWENIKAFGIPYWVKDMIEVYHVGDHIFYEEKNGKN